MSASNTRYGTTSGSPTYWARKPDTSGPKPIPPRLAAVAMISARRRDIPPRPAASSSLRYAVAVAVSMPTLMPDTTRATSRPGTVGQSRKITPDATLTATAMTAIRRRPSQSDR